MGPFRSLVGKYDIGPAHAEVGCTVRPPAEVQIGDGSVKNLGQAAVCEAISLINA
jgi:hypothetical protein